MLVAVYKEKGPTSRDVLNKIKHIVGEKKIGHAGTLDPLAEGVLVVGIGRDSTKKLHSDNLNKKEYIATIRLGRYSTTDDKEGEEIKVLVKNIPDLEEIKKVISVFSERVVMQIPPKFSAVKIKGREAYKWAREGKEVKIVARKAEINKITILSYRYPLLKIKVITGKGVYIRSLARDIGEKLNTGAFLLSLIRTKVGSFTLKDCVNFDFFKTKF